MLSPQRPASAAVKTDRARAHLADWALVGVGLMAVIALAMGTALLAQHLAPPTSVERAALPAPGHREAEALPDATVEATRDTEAAQNAGRADGSSAPSSGVIVLAAPTPTTAQSAATPTPPPPQATLPAAFLLRDVPLGKQTRSLNCEFQSASDLAWYYGRPFTWEEIFHYVGHDPGGNPHKGFVGRSLDDKPGQLYPYGYGVYAEPIAAALAKLGLTAEVHYNRPQTWLMAQVASGRPVMVWATANLAIQPVATWTAADGALIRGVPGEHTYLIVGYDADSVWLVDPWDGQRRAAAWRSFLASWSLLDRMALIVTSEPAVATRPPQGP